jgi:transketolase
LTLLTALTGRHLRFDSADPHWPDRDRLLLGVPRADAPGGAELPDGPPGLAFGAALGLAMAERLLAARFGRSLVDHRVWLLAGPRDLVSGTAQEAAAMAGALTLGKLAVLATLPADQPRLRAGFAAAGWTVRLVRQGDDSAADAALAACLRAQKPSLVLQIGTAPPPPDGPAPEPSVAEKRGIGARRAWLKRLRRHASRQAFQHALTGHLPAGWQKHAHSEDPPSPAAPSSTQIIVLAALARLAPILPELAALPGATGAKTGELSWEGRDLAAAAGLLGMAMHGGLLPVRLAGAGGAESSLAALRAGAARQARWLTLLDGPPDAVAGLDAVRGLHVYRPADAAEALDCLVLALRRTDGPCVMLVSQAPYTRLPPATPHLCARGAYLVHAPKPCGLTLLAAGENLAASLRVYEALAALGVPARLVSMPCRALFDQQEESYRRGVLHGRLVTIGAGAGFAGLTGPGDLALDNAGPDQAGAMAAAILRHRQRDAGDLDG